MRGACTELVSGAGDGNRTHVSSLGSCSSTIELHPQPSDCSWRRRNLRAVECVPDIKVTTVLRGFGIRIARAAAEAGRQTQVRLGLRALTSNTTPPPTPDAICRVTGTLGSSCPNTFIA